jgi:outer membrane lipoprotein carrier protein
MDRRAALSLVHARPVLHVVTNVFRSALICSIIVCTAMAAADSRTTDALIAQVEARYNKAQTLSVHFEESYSLLGRKRPPESGTLKLRKTGKMRWDYTRPEGKLFISDGKTIFLYTSGDNRVEKVPVRDTEDMRAPLAFLLGKLELKKEFRDFQVRQQPDGALLSALPRTDRLPYRAIEMLIDDNGSIRQLQVAGRDESLLSYVFRDEKLNIPLSDSIFHFTIPSDAEVVDAVSYKPEGKS